MEETWTLEAGLTVFHGTAHPAAFEDEDDLEGPFWVSDDEHVARNFARWSAGRYRSGPEPRPRLLRFVVEQPVELLLWRTDADVRDFLERIGADDALSPYEMAEEVCAQGFDGWAIPSNYPTGADIMICDPNDVLRLADPR